MSRTQAESALEAANLELGKETKRASSKVAKNRVIESDPDAGSTVKAGSSVDIVVSSGDKKYQLEDYVGDEYATIKARLEKAGFTVKRKRRTSVDIPAGEIMAQSLDAGTSVSQADKRSPSRFPVVPRRSPCPTFLGKLKIRSVHGPALMAWC